MPHYSDYGGYSYSDEGELAKNVDGENLGENIYLRENSIYTIVDGPLTWSEAEKQAQAFGGHLVSLNSEDESDFVLENFSNSNDLVNNQGNFHTFLGIYDDADGNFYWNDGSEVTWTNWAPRHPYSGHPLRKENWDINDISIELQNPHPYPDEGGKWLNGTPWPSDSIAEIPFIRRGDSAYVIVEGPTWEEAEANANKLGGHLVSIESQNEFDWLRNNIPIIEDLK